MTATLGQVIRRRRMELGLTQEELAERVGDGVRQAEISRLERDRVTLPRRARLEQIAQALQLPLGVLLARSGWVGAEEAFEPAATLAERDEPEPAPESGPATLAPAPADAPLEVSSPEPSLIREEMPHLTDAIVRARELTRHTEDVIRDAQGTYERARRIMRDRRRGRFSTEPENSG